MKYLIAIIAALVFIACVAKAARSAEALEIRVIDGDTFDARPKLEFGVLLDEKTFRIYNFDAWEARRTRASLELSPLEWTEELRKGKAAKASLEHILLTAKKVEVREVMNTKRDPWGRVLVEVYADGKYVADLMKEKGHARKEILVGKEAKPDSPAPQFVPGSTGESGF